MEREGRGERGNSKTLEPEFVLQWGKRLRCIRIKHPSSSSDRSNNGTASIRRKITSRVVSDSDHRITREEVKEDRKSASASPTKEERYYTTRGSSVASGGAGGTGEESGRGGKASNGGGGEEKRGEGGEVVWPKLYVTLSSKEKEEDFMAMKGCKLPQRPKKRAKFIQRTLLLVSPGAWLSDMCQERYEVREKKSSKKRPRGLKAMGAAMDSDSE